MSQLDKYETLKRIKGLLDAGILSQEEFDREKAKILGNNAHNGLNEEQRAEIKKLEALKDAGIINEKEFEDRRRAIRTPEQITSAIEGNTPAVKRSSPQTIITSSTPPPKKKKTLWIILGLIVVIIIAGQLGNNSGGEYGLSNSPYSEIDNYIRYNDNYYREGNTVYYKEYEDIIGQGVIGSIMQNPNILSPLGESATDFGQLLSGGFREVALNSAIKEDLPLFRLIVSNHLNFCYVWNDRKLYTYTPDEIKRRLSSY